MKKHNKNIFKPIVAFLLAFVMVLSSTAFAANAATKYENNIPVIYQTDYTKTICTIDGEPRSVSSSGCGATSASMAIRFYTGNKTQTPETLFQWAYDNGYYYGDGLSHDAVSKLNALYGVTCTWTDSSSDVVKAIKAGKPVIAHMGKGTFTGSGHYIVLTGYKVENSVEMIRVNDPNSSKRTGQYYSLDTITSQRRKTGADFGICSYTNATSKLSVSPSLASTSITVGSSCNISGKVTSNYLIESVVGKIVNSSGTAVQTQTIKPNSTSVSLGNTAINSKLKFGSLSAGSYTLKVTAKDASGKSKTSSISFTVKAKTSTLTVSPSMATTTITQGKSCNISGTVTSNYNITSVVGKIVNSSGTTVQSKSITPNSKSVSLSGTVINSGLKFGQLSAGSYTLKITAKDSSGKSKTSSISFTVKAVSAASKLTVSPSLASTTIQQGKGCNITGTVTSNYKITKIVGSFVNASGTTVQKVTIQPNSTSVTIKNTALNQNLKFGSLSKGNYTLKITATDTSGTTKTATRSFTIK